MSDAFLEQRRKARRFFNLIAIFYPVVEWVLLSDYRKALQQLNLSSDNSVLDLATGTGLVAGSFAERNHRVTGVDFSPKLLKRAKKRHPKLEFKQFDLVHLSEIPNQSYDIISMGYFLHGISPGFRRYILNESARIARKHIVILDYCCRGSFFIRFIEWMEGPYYHSFINTSKEELFGEAGLVIEKENVLSAFSQYWLLKSRKS